MTNKAIQPRRSHWVTFALMQGILAPIIFALTAIAGGVMRPDYSHVFQAISELTEAGAADKIYLDPPLLLMEILTILFGLGFFWTVRFLNWQLKSSALLLMIIGAGGMFFYRYPMDPMGAEMTSDGKMHLVIVTASALAAILSVFLSARGWMATSDGRTMARMSYTVLSVVLLTGFGSIFVAVWGWPGIGIWQRVNTGAFSVWQIATAITLMRSPTMQTQ